MYDYVVPLRRDLEATLKLKKTLFTLIALLTLWGGTAPAQAQYRGRHPHRRHCFYRHHRRICRYY